MSTAIDHVRSFENPLLNPNFALDEDGMPVYLGDTEQELADDWDSVNDDLDKDHWKLAAVASTIVTKYGENNVGNFAYEHKNFGPLDSRSVTDLSGVPIWKALSKSVLWLHFEASKAKNPVKAAKIAHDREMSTRELKRWIYMGEGRQSRGASKELGAAPSASDSPTEITVDAEDPDSEEDISIEDEELPEEERALLLADLQLCLRMTAVAIARLKTGYALRYLLNLQQELDWELEVLTKGPGTLGDRVESLILGGCWIPADIQKRAKIATKAELDRICERLRAAGKIKWSRERKRKHGTAPEMWMPSDMPDGDEFNMPRSQYENGEDNEEHF